MCYLVERGLSALKGVVRGEPQKLGGGGRWGSALWYVAWLTR